MDRITQATSEKLFGVLREEFTAAVGHPFELLLSPRGDHDSAQQWIAAAVAALAGRSAPLAQK